MPPDLLAPAPLAQEPPESAAPDRGAAGQVLYRKWRPQTFSEISAQEAVVRTLRNSVAGGKPAHAYLFCGPRGTGKTTMGRLLAKAVCCESAADGEPCNRCVSCQAFLDGRAADLIEMDAASNRGIEEMRRLKDRVGLAPMGGRYKVYLVDEVHMLTQEAYNALLKTLEEPPPHVIFVLATTEAHKVPSTIISRCQRFDLHRIPLAATVERLGSICREEGFTISQESLQEVARSASGSLRDAINTLEQLVTYYGPAPALEQTREMLGLNTDARSRELARAVLGRQQSDALRIIAAVRDDGVDLRLFTRQLVACLREVLLVKSGAADALDAPADYVQELQELAAALDVSDVLAALKGFSALDFREGVYSSLPLELASVEFVIAGSAPAARPAPAAAPAPLKPVARVSQPPAEKAAPPPAEPAEPQPSVAAAPATESDDLLEQVRADLKDSHKQVAALLNGSCEVASISEDTVTLGVYFSFHVEKLQAAPVRTALEAAISKRLGRTMQVRCEQAEPGPASPRGKKGQRLSHMAQELGAVLIEDE